MARRRWSELEDLRQRVSVAEDGANAEQKRRLEVEMENGEIRRRMDALLEILRWIVESRPR